MPASVKTYSPADVYVIFGGAPMTGLAPDGFVTIEPLADLVSAMVGADGEIARTLNTDRRFNVTIALLQTSASNDILSGFVTLDRVRGGLTVPIAVTDLRGRTNFAASQAWIRAYPSVGYSSEGQTREWAIETGEPAAWFVGGNF